MIAFVRGVINPSTLSTSIFSVSGLTSAKTTVAPSYRTELDDATKILNDKDGNPVNFGSMKMDDFLQAREHIDNNQIEKIQSHQQ